MRRTRSFWGANQVPWGANYNGANSLRGETTGFLEESFRAPKDLKHAWNVSGYKAWLDYKQMKQLPRWLQHSQWAEEAFFSGQVHSRLPFIPATGHKSSAIKMGYSGQWHSLRGFFQCVEQCLNQIIVLNLFLCAVPSMHKPQYQDLSYSAGDACPLQ